MTRIHAVADPGEVADPAYAQGLRASVGSAIEYGLIAVERGEERAPPVPGALLAQAGAAARHRVGLDTVLRRYFAGYTVFSDYLVREATATGLLERLGINRLLADQAALLDRLVRSISSEYARQTEDRHDLEQRRLGERVERLLAGDPLDTSGLAYAFEVFHTGVVARGPGAAAALRESVAGIDSRLLLVQRTGETVWAWLGGRRRLDPAELAERLSCAPWPEKAAIALGEPARGMAGWRLTHAQARAGLAVALQRPRLPVRYADIALTAAILRDETAAASLRQLYLAPLGLGREGEVARRTLRAYFTAERNVSAAAAALGVNRNTVASRLRAIEERLGRPLGTCATDLDAALRWEEHDRRPLPMQFAESSLEN